LRGKILNSWEIDKVKLLSNAEVNNIATAIGIQAHDSVDQYNDSSLRYGKICILADADVDGAHIQVLLVTLFLKHFPGLVKEGRLFVARPPLYRIDFEGKYRKEFGEKVYILDDYELQEKKKMFLKKKVPDNVFRISRFKGLGEMSASQLWETTLSPENRRLTNIFVDDGSVKTTNKVMNLLMSKSEAPARRKWMQLKGNQAEIDI
jgi:topoisomerase-4 subunit B